MHSLLKLNNYDYIFKIIIVGDTNTGKTSLFKKYINFNSNNISTIGVDYYTKELYLNNKDIKLQLWDTAGQEKYLSITKSYYRNANCILLCFDLTNEKTFNSLDMWIKNINDLKNDKAIIYLLGNKCDMKNTVISKSRINNFMLKNNIKNYYETSSINSININKIFIECSIELIDKTYNNNTYNNKIYNNDKKIPLLTENKNYIKKKCLL
jgi:small GTP-binding protein